MTATPIAMPPGSRERFEVRGGRNRYHLIPYIGNKSGFAEIFRELMPCGAGQNRIIDVFGGSGAFAIWSSFQFGSGQVTYNDNNPVLVNFMGVVRDDPKGLIAEYGKHRERSSNDYFMGIRGEPLQDGLRGAGIFLYLAKNAFSGKIRFNGSNKFNAPMRKGTRCPALDADRVRDISKAIQGMEITNESFQHFQGTRGALLYLDPPYMNNTNAHYNMVPSTDDFAEFVKNVTPHNHIMISEQNEPADIGIPGSYRVYDIILRRSLQYVTRNDSREIVAINYEPARCGGATR